MLNLVCIIYENIFAEFLSKTFKKSKQSRSVFNVKIIYLFSKILFKAYLSILSLEAREQITMRICP